MTTAEERKKRQEKFRKRTGSLFDKVKKLAEDTDAFVALIVRDRAGKIRSFRSSDSLYWPHSIKDLIEQSPLGTHQYLQKYATSGCWKGVDIDESVSILMGRNRSLTAEAVRAMRVTSAEIVTEPDSTITVALCDIDKEADIDASGLRNKETGIGESAEAVTSGSGSDSTAMSNESNQTTIEVLKQSEDTTVDFPRESSNETLDADGEPDDTVAELEKPDKMTNVVRGTNNIELNALVELDKAGNVLGKSMPFNMLDSEVNPSFDSDMLNFDTAEIVNSAEFDDVDMFEVDDSIKAGATLYTIGQRKISSSSANHCGWQLVSRPREGLKSSTGIDRKGLLDGWDWVFQKR